MRPIDLQLRLLRLADAPPRIYLEGRIPEPWPPTVAIVGARRCSAEARFRAEAFAAKLSAAGLWVVSGGALGIDAAAHRGALSLGRTIVVLPTGLDRPAPAQNRPLFRRIVARGGLCLSEWPPDRPPQRSAFCQRNRLIAALADYVLVVAAAARSGVRHTVAAAGSLGVPVGALPWGLGDRGGAYNLELLAEGVDLVRAPRDILRSLSSLIPERSPSLDRIPPVGTPDERRLLSLLASGPWGLEALALHLALPPVQLLLILGRLELRGQIRRVGAQVQLSD